MCQLIFSAAALHRSDIEKDISAPSVDNNFSTSETALADDDASSTSVMHRKHKKIHRSAAASAVPALQDSSLGTEGQVPLAPVNPYRKPANPYVAYRNIKMKVNSLHFSVNKSELFVGNL